MRLLHSLAKTHVSFDDPNLVARAGLVPVMALAQRAGLATWSASIAAGECGVNAPVKIGCLVAALADQNSWFSCRKSWPEWAKASSVSPANGLV